MVWSKINGWECIDSSGDHGPRVAYGDSWDAPAANGKVRTSRAPPLIPSVRRKPEAKS